ncbi:protocadherin fat [Biomphalaria glabrata]
MYAVSATDKDEGINQKIVYKLEDTTEDSDFFYVDPLTGLLSSVQKLIRAHYYFKVKASDLGSPSMFTWANVTVNVQSNEIIPTLSVVPESVMLYVGMSQGYVLNVTLNATNTGVLQIAGGNEDQIFTLQNNKISLSHILSQPKDYLLVLEASNRPISQHTSTAKLQVSVRSVEFDQINYFANETENDKSLPRLICQLGSPAKQIAAVKYTLYNYNDQFKLDAGNGQLSVVQSLDRESLSVYVLNVSVSIVADGQSQGRRKREAQNSAVGYAKVIVQVGDENDNIPTFGSSLYFNLPASISDGALISQIQAFDPDEGINGLLQYRITKGNSAAFSLDLQSGQFKVNNSTVLSTQQKWELQVSATDQNGAGHTAFTDVTIYVQNSSLYTLPASIPLSLFQSNQKEIIRSLGVLLGYTVVFNQAAKIKDSTTAISFSALDPVSNSTVSTDDIGKKVQASLSDISDLFNSYLKSAKSASNKDEGAYTTTSIVLIVIGCVMFVVSLFAILVAYLLWKKQKLYAQKEENAARVREKLGQQMTMTHKVSNASSDPDGHLEMDIDLDDSSLFSPDMFSNKTKELAQESTPDVEEQESRIVFETEFQSDVSTVALRKRLVDMKTQQMQALFQSISEEDEELNNSRRGQSADQNTQIEPTRVNQGVVSYAEQPGSQASSVRRHNDVISEEDEDDVFVDEKSKPNLHSASDAGPESSLQVYDEIKNLDDQVPSVGGSVNDSVPSLLPSQNEGRLSSGGVGSSDSNHSPSREDDKSDEDSSSLSSQSDGDDSSYVEEMTSF